MNDIIRVCLGLLILISISACGGASLQPEAQNVPSVADNLPASPAPGNPPETGTQVPGMIVDEETTQPDIQDTPASADGGAKTLVEGAEPAPVPIVYSKANNIYAYDVQFNEVIPLTADGSAGYLKGYYNPVISPDGAYAAFESSTHFFIRELTSGETTIIDKQSKPEILADTLMGWDRGGGLYYTRTNGDCVFAADGIRGPESVEVLRYDPLNGKTALYATLPKVDDAPHAYAIGISVSPTGRFIKAYNAACSVGLGSTFLFDSQSGTYEMDNSGSSSLSHSEDRTAFTTGMEGEGGLPSVVIEEPGSGKRTTIYSGAEGSRLTTPVWSPDDFYVAFLENQALGEDPLAGSGYYDPSFYTPFRIMIVPTGSGGGAAVIQAPGEGHSFGDWSPDGRSIVYTQRDPAAQSEDPDSLMIFNLDTGRAVEVDRGVGIYGMDW